jgi:hypothetical protein
VKNLRNSAEKNVVMPVMRLERGAATGIRKNVVKVMFIVVKAKMRGVVHLEMFAVKIKESAVIRVKKPAVEVVKSLLWGGYMVILKMLCVL